MNLGSIFRSVNFLTNKDLSGYSFSPDEFSLVVQMVQLSMYSDAIEAKKTPSSIPKLDEDISINILGQLTKTATLTTPYPLPVDFFHECSLTSDLLDAEILDARRYNEQVADPFYETTRTLAKIEAGKVIVSNTPTALSLIYYRIPADPYFDWIFTVDGVVVYMEPQSSLLTNGANLDLVRARVAYASSTAYSVGDRVTYSGLAYEVNTAVLNTNTTPPTSNPSFTSVGNIVIASIVSHVSPTGTNGYVSASVELDIPLYYTERFIQQVYKWSMTNLQKAVQ